MSLAVSGDVFKRVAGCFLWAITVGSASLGLHCRSIPSCLSCETRRTRNPPPFRFCEVHSAGPLRVVPEPGQLKLVLRNQLSRQDPLAPFQQTACTRLRSISSARPRSGENFPEVLLSMACMTLRPLVSLTTVVLSILAQCSMLRVPEPQKVASVSHARFVSCRKPREQNMRWSIQGTQATAES